MLAIIFFNAKPKFLNIEQRLLQKLLYFNVSMYIKELMFLGIEYSFLYPLILTLESTKGYFFTSPLLRVNELLKLNFNIKNFNIFSFKAAHKYINSYLPFLKLMSSFNHINAFSSSLHIMSNTGAKANWNQICQLIGVRGYLVNASGEFFKVPVLSSFNKGLSLFEYFISCYGARKGILDTALKTADAGYLTRRLVESTQELVIKEYTCGSNNSLEYTSQIDSKGSVNLPFFLFLSGKVLQRNLIEINTKKVLEFQFNYISDKLIKLLYFNILNFSLKVNTFSVKTCLSGRTICSTCFGYTALRINTLGKSVGVLAGQVIGEPGTQLTLRTFHTGGASGLALKDSSNNGYFILNSKYLYLLKTNKYRLCVKSLNTWKKNKPKIFSFVFLKQYHFIIKSPYVCYILKKNKINQVLSLNDRLAYVKNNIHLSISLITYLSLNKVFQRKTPSTCMYKYYTYIGEFLYKNVIQLIIKNKYNKWIIVNLNKSILFNTIFSTYSVSHKGKIIFINSKNQRFSKLFITKHKNFLYSYRELKNSLSYSENIYILNIIFSANYYWYKRRYISFSNIIYKDITMIKLFELSARNIRCKSIIK